MGFFMFVCMAKDVSAYIYIYTFSTSLEIPGRGGMASKIEAATSAVLPGSKCGACVVASGADLNSIRAVLGPSPKYGCKGTLFVTPGSDLATQAIHDIQEESVRTI